MNLVNFMDLSQKETVRASTPYANLSDEYSMVSTADILETFRADGWVPTDYREKKVRVAERIGKQQHCIVLTRTDAEGSMGSTVPRIMLKNSHDGTSSLQLLSGLFERICANGLVVGASAEDVRFRHLGLTEETIRVGIQRVTSSLERAINLSDRMKAITLDDRERLEFSEKVINMVWGGTDYRIAPTALLWNHRQEQRVPTLWNTFNTVQERIIRGGVPQYRLNGTSIRSREVKAIDRSISLNQLMWDIAEDVCTKN
jgi:hypothetical protein